MVLINSENTIRVPLSKEIILPLIRMIIITDQTTSEETANTTPRIPIILDNRIEMIEIIGKTTTPRETTIKIIKTIARTTDTIILILIIGTIITTNTIRI